VQQSIDISCLHRVRSSKPAAAACSGWMGQTDGRPTDSYTLLRMHTMRAMPIKKTFFGAMKNC